MTEDPMTVTSRMQSRIAFVVLLARRLHEYGTAAPRLEEVVSQISSRLDLVCNVMSTPTSIIMSFIESGDDEDSTIPVTQVVRMSPGAPNLRRLVAVDEIADGVISGRLDLAEGKRLLREEVDAGSSMREQVVLALTFGIAAAAIAMILQTGLAGTITAAVNGWLVGGISIIAWRHPNVAPAFEAVSSLLATIVTILVAAYVHPIHVQSVVIASVVVLLPGMALTTAVREISTMHLMSGGARFAGAMATLLKLVFGAVAGTHVCAVFGIVPASTPTPDAAWWMTWGAMVVAGFSFAVLFKSPLRYYPVVMMGVALAYACTQVGGLYATPAFGVFLGGLAISASSNLFAHVYARPGALIREPGIVLLVPGSVGFRTMSFMFERDLSVGMDAALSLVTLLVAIVAGLLFGDLLVPPRRKLL